MSFSGRQPFLEFTIFDTRGGDCSDGYYQACFDLWRQIWSDTYDKLEGSTGGLPHCDAWFAATRVAGIAIAGRPIAVCLMSQFGKGLLESNMCRSSLGAFPGELVHQVHDQTRQQAYSLINGLAVDRAYRKSRQGWPVPVSELLIALMLKHIALFDPSQIFVYTRNSKKINLVAYGHGFQALARNRIRHNVAVDFTTCDSGQLTESPDSNIRWYADDLFQQFLNRSGQGQMSMSA